MGCAQTTASRPSHCSSKFAESFVLEETLGQGKFGLVCVATEEGGGRQHAVKLVQCKNATELLAAEHESGVWRRVGKHPHCVQLRQTFLEDSLLYMVMERCRCTVAHEMESLWGQCEEGFMWILRQTLLGLMHVHEAGVVHRDIKPENIFLGGANGMTVKIGDFGESALMPPCGQPLYGMCGTLHYMSPEMVSMKGHTQSTDIWSFGVLVYRILFGTFPYNPLAGDPATVRLAILCGAPSPRFLPGKRISRTRPVSNSLMFFVQALLQHKPLHRPSARVALEHSVMSRCRPHNIPRTWTW